MVIALLQKGGLEMPINLKEICFGCLMFTKVLWVSAGVAVTLKTVIDDDDWVFMLSISALILLAPLIVYTSHKLSILFWPSRKDKKIWGND